MRPRSLYPRVDRDYSSLPELVVSVQTDEGLVEKRMRVASRVPLRDGMTIGDITLEQVAFVDGTYYAVASA